MTDPPVSWLMSLALARPRVISLAAGFTDNPSLPVERSRRLLDSLFSEQRLAQSALQYGTTPGAPELRELTAARVRLLDQNRGPAALYDPARVVMTHGSQQLLYLLTECLCDEGDIVLVEDPTYFVFLGIADSRGLQCRAIRTETDGLNLDHLRETLEALEKAGELPRVKMLYLISYHQNPSGITTSFDKKSRALELLRRFERAAGHPLYLLEDAAYRELSFGGESEPSGLVARHGDRVLYAGTYSKSFATGTRVGFGFLPEPILTSVLHAKTNHDFGTSNFLQVLLCLALKSGDYAAHILELQQRYEHKARVMLDAMECHFPEEVEWVEPKGGLYFWARMPRRCSTSMRSKLFKAALDAEVLYVPGDLCYASDPTRRKPDCEMRLSFGGASEENIREGIKRLGDAMKKQAIWRKS
jgi:2-aminoadipate transaminase